MRTPPSAGCALPARLREAAGFSYQEFSNLEHPLALKGDPFHVGAENNLVSTGLSSSSRARQSLAYYDHPFFGKWPAITENEFGAGTLLYEGTYLSDKLQTAVLHRTLDKLGLTGPDQHARFSSKVLSVVTFVFLFLFIVF
jgi:beta-galactosidase